MPAQNTNLGKARKAKNDEFYTQYIDIQNEMKHYKSHFENKVVYCNCDDPTVSQFFHFFFRRFKHLKLKKLITTCYKSQERDLFSKHDSEKAISLQYDGYRVGENMPNVEDIGIHHLASDGDFRNEETIALLKQADIVSTNPPFSLFREYLAQLIKYDKKFIIVGNMNAVTYKETFQLIKEGKVWYGRSIHSGDREFGVPNHYGRNKANCRIDENGNKFIRVNGVRWFTNLDYKERHEDLILYRKYTPEEYPNYDNYDAINVNKTTDIPADYAGVMGVPISFLDKYNPDQFEIVGNEYDLNIDKGRGYVNGKRMYSRIFIKNKKL